MPDLSDYENRRVENIKRNNARLRELGLISEREEEASNAAASNQVVLVAQQTVKKDIKQEKKRKDVPAPSRQSKRLKGLKADKIEIDEHDHVQQVSTSFYTPMTEEERAEVLRETREGRLRAANEVAKAGATIAAKNNPTASYEHTMMRIRTMNEKGLKNRVKMIENRAGKHCVIKMAIFKSCLQDQHMWDLAKLAAEALERLKGLEPPPPKDE